MKQLLQNIRQWGIDRNIIGPAGKSNPTKQHEKTQEEVDELRDAIKALDRPEVADAIGDIVVTLVLQADMWGFDLEECVQGAYETIANRTGKIVDGIFVKDGDTEAQKQRRADNSAKRQEDVKESKFDIWWYSEGWQKMQDPKEACRTAWSNGAYLISDAYINQKIPEAWITDGGFCCFNPEYDKFLENIGITGRYKLVDKDNDLDEPLGQACQLGDETCESCQ